MSVVHVIEGRPVEDLIIGATDGTLSEASQASLRTHLDSCSTCAELSSEHARLAQRLATPVESPAAMDESLARVRQAASAKPRLAWARPRSAIALLAGVTAALVVAVLASLAIGESVARLQIPSANWSVSAVSCWVKIGWCYGSKMAASRRRPRRPVES